MQTEAIAVTPDHHHPSQPRAFALVAAMALGSIVMWVGIPVAWILVAAHFSHSGSPSLGPLLIFFIGTPLTMLPTAKLLGHLDLRHQELMGRLDDRRKPAPWQRSMRDDRDERAPQSVLAVVMVTSVALAFVALAIWFFFFAGSSLPS